MSALVDEVVPSYAMATMAKVLVIDGCESVARNRCALLARHDLPCKYATTAAGAIAVARIWQPQLVVIDLGSPQLGGFFAQSLRDIPGMQRVCIIGITDDSSQLRRGQTGIDQFLTKSTSADEFIDAVHAGCSQLAS